MTWGRLMDARSERPAESIEFLYVLYLSKRTSVSAALSRYVGKKSCRKGRRQTLPHRNSVCTYTRHDSRRAEQCHSLNRWCWLMSRSQYRLCRSSTSDAATITKTKVLKIGGSIKFITTLCPASFCFAHDKATTIRIKPRWCVRSGTSTLDGGYLR